MKNISAQKAVLTLISKADRLYQGGHIDAAVELLSKGIQFKIHAKELYYALTEMLLEDEQYQVALDVIEDLPSECHDIRKVELKGFCLEGLQRYQLAEEVIDPLISVETPSAPVLNLKGMLLFHRQEKLNAQIFFERSIQSDSSYGPAYINLGLLKLDQGEANRSLEILEKGFVNSPHINHVVETYYELISEINAYDRAEQLFKDACQRFPRNKRLAYLMIDILIQQNKLKGALANIQTAIATFGVEDGILEPALKIKKALGSMGADQKKGNISLCMIVKNEEQYLAKCLESVKNAVSEIVVVDTGSQDRSKDIASIFGANVYGCEWKEDFSDARNLSISKAKNDWIFILDADEVVAARDLEALRNITQNSIGGHSAYSFVTRNYTNDAGTEGWRANDDEYEKEQADGGWNPSEKARLFPNNSRIRFENPVHELVEPSLRRAGIKLRKCDVPIHHYGMLNQEKTVSKKEKYYSLGKRKLATINGDLSALIECAIQAAEVGKYAESVKLWHNVLKVKPDLPKAYFNLSYAYIQLEQYSNGLKAARQAMELDPNLKEATLNYALCLLRLGDIGRASGHLEKFLVDSPGHPMASGLLAVACCISDNVRRGIELFNEVHKRGFNCSEYISDHARKLVSVGNDQHAVSLLESVAKSRYVNKEIRSLLAEITRVEIDNPRLKIQIFNLKNVAPELSPYLRPLTEFPLSDNDFFALTANNHRPDFIFFPYSLDPLFHHLGREGLFQFLENLNGFREKEHKFVFFLLDDISSPFGIKSVIYRVNHHKHKTDFNSITLPHFVDDIFTRTVNNELPYHVNFVGTLVTHLLRAYMLLPFLKNTDLPLYSSLLEKLELLLDQRKNEEIYRDSMTDVISFVQKIFPINPTIQGIRYFFDISVEQFHKLPNQIQLAKKAELVDLINKSVTTLCPRGFGVQSIRFFETLSAGRLPILISDNYRLPLENHIGYSDFIWKVDEGKIIELPNAIRDLFESHTEKEIIERSNKARETWQNYLAPSQRNRFIYITLTEVLKMNYRLNKHRIN